MGLLDTILGGSGGGAGAELGKQFGLSGDQVSAALGQLVPALNRGVRKNTEKKGGLDALLGALDRGDHQRYVDQPDLVGQQSTREEGNAILGHIFGSKDVSRQVAQRAGEKTGIDSGILKKLLPVAASMLMGSLSKNRQSFAPGGQASGGMLSKLLDSDGDGSMADDLLDMAKKLF